MQDSKNKKNAGADSSMAAELTASERRKRGLARKSMSTDQRREILNQLFFEDDMYWSYVKQFYLLLALSALIASF